MSGLRDILESGGLAMTKTDKQERGCASGCLVVVALFFIVLMVMQCNEEQASKRPAASPTPTYSAPPPTDTAQKSSHKPTKFYHANKGIEDEDDIDPYDAPDFDDLFPGEEYDEEFVDRSIGDPELYDESGD